MTHYLLPSPRLRRWTRRGFAGTVLCAALAACGGGGGGDDAAAGPAVVAPPGTAAAFGRSDSEIVAAMQGVNQTAAQLLVKCSALDGGAFLTPLGASGSPMNMRNIVARSTREQALARETIGCAELGFSACTGTVTIDTSLSNGASTAPAGSYLAMSFNSLNGSFEGETLSLNGTFRVEFLTALNLSAPNFANARMNIVLSAFGGTVGGVTFEPETVAALYEFDAEGGPIITTDGLRINGLPTIDVTDATNYRINNLILRRAHWTATTGYVDLQFTSWTVNEGRPAEQSMVLITAGDNSLDIRVTARTADTVSYYVTAYDGVTISSQVVTATYSANGGAPTYTVEPASP